MATLANLNVNITANTAKYMKGMKAMNGMNVRAGKSLTKFAKIAAGVGAVGLAAFAAMTVKSVKAFVEFEKGLKEVTTLSKFTSAEIKHMSKETLKMGRQFGQTFKVLHKARYDIVSAGFASITEQTLLLNQANKMAVAGVTDVSTATDLLTSALNAYNLEASDAEDVSDIFFETVKAGKTTIEELAAAMGSLMPIAKGAGVALDEVAAAMATATAAGISTRESATGLRTMFKAMAAPTTAAAKAMTELGITTVDTQGNMLPMLDVIKQFEGMSLDTITKLIPSEEAAKAVLALANNVETLEDNLIKMERRTGSTDIAFKIMADSASFKIDQLKMWWQSFLVTMGEDTAIGDTLGSLLEMLEKNETELIAAAKALGIFVGWISTSSLSLITDWIKLLSDSGDGTSNLRVELDMLNDDINEKMIGTLDSLFNKLGTSWDGVLPYWQGAMATIKSFYSGWLNGLVSLGKAGWTAIGNAFKTVWRIIKQTLQGNMAAAWNTVKTTAVGVAVAIKKAFVGAINRVIARVSALINKFDALKKVKNFLGFSGGGPVAGYASGGNILGQGGVDNVPIMATAGEFMVKKSVAEKNYGALAAINSGQSGTFQFMADGGPVASTAAMAATAVDVSDVQQSWEELWENWPPEPPPLPPVPYGPLGAPPAPKDTGIGAEGGDMLGTVISNENLEKFMENGMIVETTWDQIMGNMKDATAAATESMVGGGFDVMADAMSNLVQGEKMFTAAHGAAMMKMAAQTILAIGKQAAVWAAFEIGKGIKSIAEHDPVAATGHFMAAAKFGAVAIGAMAVGGAMMGAAGKMESGADAAGGTGGSAAADTPYGAAGAPGGAAEGAEDTADGSGLVVNIHVEGHIVDEQKFLEEVVMPNMAKAVGRGAAYDGQYDMISERT